MKTMVVWRIVPGKYKAAIEQFVRTGGPVPPGAKTIGRWHAPGSYIGWHLIEGDLAAVGQHVAEWAELLEYDVYPVMEDAEAAAVGNKVSPK